jgi:ATP-dependent Clp protease protease subunit
MTGPERRQLSAWLQAQLFERRIVLLTRPLDDHAAAEVAAALSSLDAAGPAPIELHVASGDGILGATFVVIDTIDRLRAPVHARCRGVVGGTVVGVVASAERSAATPHTRFRLAQPTARFSGPPETIAAQSRHQQDLLWRLYARLARRTARPAEEIAEDIRRGRYLTAREALDYGLIDDITG